MKKNYICCSLRKIYGAAIVIFLTGLTLTSNGQNVGVDFQQAANQDHPAQPIRWINSALIPNNSDYFEGMSVPQRVIFFNLHGTLHEMSFQHKCTKNGIHAYDFLTSWEQAWRAANVIGNGSTNELQYLFSQMCQNVGSTTTAPAQHVCTDLSGLALSPNDSTSFFPPHPNIATSFIYDFSPSSPDTNSISTMGNPPHHQGQNVDDVLSCYQAAFGNRTIEIRADASIGYFKVKFTGYTSSGADDYANYTLVWETHSNSREAMILLAGHLAAGEVLAQAPFCGYGAGLGAGSINGAPYHFKLSDLDGSPLGSQDNQIMTSAVQTTPVCNITGNNIICIGGNTQFCAASGMSNYQWSSGQTTQCITVTTAGTYTVTITNASGGTSSCSETLTVSPGPPCSIESPIPGNIICNSGNYTISTLLSSGLYSFSWSMTVDGNPNGWAIIGSNTGQTITFSAGDCGSPGFLAHFTLTVTDLSNGCVTTCSRTFAPGAPACIVQIRPAVQFNCLISSQYLLASYNTDIINPQFMWTRNGSPIGPGINDGIGLDSILITLPGTYRFTIHDNANSANDCFAEIVVTQDNTPPVCSIVPSSSSVCIGDSVTLTASGGTFLWSTGATTASITVSPSVATTYTVTVTASNGCTSSCSATVTVNQVPACAISGADNICPASSNVYTGPNGMSSYNWSVTGNGSISGSSTNSSVTINAGASCGAYTVTLTVSNGCTSTCTATFNVTDTSAPVFTSCPAGSALGCNPSSVPAAGNAAATDNCGSPTITSSLGTVTSNGCSQTQTRTYTATDGCGNSATCTQVFTWTLDTIAPVITATGTTLTLGCNPSATAINDALGSATAADACGPV
ncbi:MAG: hypothetical protein JJE25_00330, partial [Bacteroidia bacterium]|nr:hypothetical protein [Bacteroidia bacterium]